MTGTRDRAPRAAPRAGWGVLVLVAAVAFAVRWQASAFLDVPGVGERLCTDPDSLYHFRRLGRAWSEGLPVAAEDPFLDHPRGAPIPWPPYYTYFLWTLLTPFAPPGAAQRPGFIELWAARVPALLGTLTAVLAAAAAGRLAGPRAALLAGLLQALCMASLQYSRQGIADHHAFVTCLLVALLAAAGRSEASHFETRGRAGRSGAAAGTLAGALVGVLLGAWAGALMYLVLLELVLAVQLFSNARRPRPGLALYGLCLHATAAVVLLPAVLASPWRRTAPWMVVNLSWFHVAHLLLGAAVFVPLLRLHAGGPAWRRYPFVLAALLLGSGATLALLPIGPGAGLREGFEWVSRQNRFMATIGESAPLLGRGAAPADLARHLGWLVWTAPLAWAWAAFRCFARGERALLPWVIAFPPLAAQAIGQRRFADPLSPALAVLLGWGAIELGRRWLAPFRPAGPLRARAWTLGAWVGVAALAVLGQREAVIEPVLRESLRAGPPRLTAGQTRVLAARRALEWMRANLPREAEGGVLADWGLGHSIEWVAERPTLATNFGTYVGPIGFHAALQFLLEEDERRAEALLVEQQARWVVVESEWTRKVEAQVASILPGRWSRYFSGSPDGAKRMLPAWLGTMGARLLAGGRTAAPGGSSAGPTLDFLRLIHAGEIADPAPMLSAPYGGTPAAFVWERVAGARLQARSRPGEELAVEIPLRYPRAGFETTFTARARADAQGDIELRVPYATLDPNGDGLAGSTSRWRLGERGGPLRLREADVLEGATVALP